MFNTASQFFLSSFVILFKLLLLFFFFLFFFFWGGGGSCNIPRDPSFLKGANRDTHKKFASSQMALPSGIFHIIDRCLSDSFFRLRLEW